MKYFKVIDSDDWVKESAYLNIVETLHDIMAGDSINLISIYSLADSGFFLMVFL